jgi:hypothetical protein
MKPAQIPTPLSTHDATDVQSMRPFFFRSTGPVVRVNLRFVFHHHCQLQDADAG